MIIFLKSIEQFYVLKCSSHILSSSRTNCNYIKGLTKITFHKPFLKMHNLQPPLTFHLDKNERNVKTLTFYTYKFKPLRRLHTSEHYPCQECPLSSIWYVMAFMNLLMPMFFNYLNQTF